MSEVLDHSSEVELIPSACQSRQAHVLEPQGGLEIGKQHLDLLPLVERDCELRHPGSQTDLIASLLVDAA